MMQVLAVFISSIWRLVLSVVIILLKSVNIIYEVTFSNLIYEDLKDFIN